MSQPVDAKSQFGYRGRYELGTMMNDWLACTSNLPPVNYHRVSDAAMATADFLLCAWLTRSKQRSRHQWPDWADKDVKWVVTNGAHVEEAALQNQAAGIEDDFDSVHYAAGGHVAAYLAPVLYSDTASPVEDRLIIQAHATEFAVRIGQGIRDPLRDASWHVTPVIGGLSAIVAMALAAGLPTRQLQWCLRLFLSSYRSDYALLHTEGRQFQARTSLRLAYDTVRASSHHRPIDRSAASAWWTPLENVGIRLPAMKKVVDGSLTDHMSTTIKTLPCCAHFFNVLQLLTHLRAVCGTSAFAELTLSVPGKVFLAHRQSKPDCRDWLQPFDLRYNSAICWLLRKPAWTPIQELPYDLVNDVQRHIKVELVEEGSPTAVTARTFDGHTYVLSDTDNPTDLLSNIDALQWKMNSVRRTTGNEALFEDPLFKALTAVSGHT